MSESILLFSSVYLVVGNLLIEVGFSSTLGVAGIAFTSSFGVGIYSFGFSYGVVTGSLVLSDEVGTDSLVLSFVEGIDSLLLSLGLAFSSFTIGLTSFEGDAFDNASSYYFLACSFYLCT